MQKVWNESEDLGRDLVDGCDSVPPRPDQQEDIEGVLLESVKLEYNARQPQSTRPFCSLI